MFFPELGQLLYNSAMKRISFFFSSILITTLISGCAPAPTSTDTAIPSTAPNPSPTQILTQTITSTPTLPPEIEVEFGADVSQQQKTQALAAVTKWIEYYRRNGFGKPQPALIYADVDRQNLLDKSYANFNVIFPQSYSQWETNTWSKRQGGMNMIVNQKGYIFYNLAHPYWDRPMFSIDKPSLGDCGIGGEMLHLYHQWLSGSNFLDVPGNVRSPGESGPQWLLIGKELVLCPDAYNISFDFGRVKFMKDLSLAPSDLLLQDLVKYKPNATDEIGYLQTAGVFYLLTESPGGLSRGAAKSLSTYFRGLADPTKTWEEVFAETWGWTPDEFYEHFEEYRQSVIPTPPNTSISGKVVNATGNPVANINVFACIEKNGKTDCSSIKTLTDGTFVIPVLSGTYDIRFSLNDGPPTLFYSKSEKGHLMVGGYDGTVIVVTDSGVVGVDVQLP